MMDRVVVLNDVSAARGGGTSLALASVRGLRARGVPITLIVGDDGESGEMRDLGVEIVALGQALLLDAGLRAAFFRGLYNRRTVEVVGDWIRRSDTPGTVYHVHTWAKILSPSVFHVLRDVADRLLVSAHDFFLVCPNGGYVHYDSGRVCDLRPMSAACVLASCDRRSHGHKLWRVARQAVRQMVFDARRTPPVVLAIHDGMRAGLERGGIPGPAIRVLRNPINAFSDTRIKAEDNREFVFIGRLNAEKGPDLAAKAARRAGARLRIIGDGPMLGDLRRDYPEIAFDGRLSARDIGQRVAFARALVMPSRYPEPFGLVAGEALWSGLPVILSETALMADEIVARGAGMAFDVLDAQALASCFRASLDADATTRAMSINAFERARDLGTTPAQWIETLVDIYRGLTDPVRSGRDPRRQPGASAPPTAIRG
jgi:glycosyltransferase involved in cell wall biosynthesis